MRARVPLRAMKSMHDCSPAHSSCQRSGHNAYDSLHGTAASMQVRGSSRIARVSAFDVDAPPHQARQSQHPSPLQLQNFVIQRAGLKPARTNTPNTRTTAANTWIPHPLKEHREFDESAQVSSHRGGLN
jgi:hypothetical protein